ncbi:PadR family transcriptional regulator [Cryptosporangium minutisporangium]|uniref:PadR family transcriptional regulator n=1 Tax=Cryptosporangium minutisporangium TaxID=113569 RepID=UPI0031EC03E4
MSTPQVLLALLATGARHGYDLKRAYDARFPKARPLAFGQVYSTLERLTRDGLAEEAGVERVDGPDRTVFAITDAGRAALRDWLDVVEPPAPHVANSLFTKVVAALLADEAPGAEGGLAVAYLRAQRRAHLARMRDFTAAKTAADASVGAVLAADYALAHLDADLRWIDLTLSRMSALRQEVRPNFDHPPTPDRTSTEVPR